MEYKKYKGSFCKDDGSGLCIEITKGDEILNAEGLVCDDIGNLKGDEYFVNQMFWLLEYTRGVSLQGHTGGKIIKITKVSNASIWWKELAWEEIGEYTWNNTYCYDITKFTNEKWIHNKKINSWETKSKPFMERKKTFGKRFGYLINYQIQQKFYNKYFERMNCDLGF
tara:strand:- start:54 stop:557 length:504 start_codon:yes stop_codon:yes gene_type:complete